jgi:hypothetical protein
MNILLNEALLGSKHISHAAILRKKDGCIKARSPNFVVSLAWNGRNRHFPNNLGNR